MPWSRPRRAQIAASAPPALSPPTPIFHSSSPSLLGVRRHPLGRRPRVVERSRVRMLGREPVVDRDRRRSPRASRTRAPAGRRRRRCRPRSRRRGSRRARCSSRPSRPAGRSAPARRRRPRPRPSAPRRRAERLREARRDVRPHLLGRRLLTGAQARGLRVCQYLPDLRIEIGNAQPLRPPSSRRLRRRGAASGSRPTACVQIPTLPLSG